MNEAVIEMRGIEKSFYGIPVLKHVDFSLYKGEVLALMGENGAGKSTLMKILCGAYTKDAGDIYLNGEKIEIKKVNDAQIHGIRMIFQELNLMEDLTVAQNIYIGKEPKKGFFIDDKKMIEDSKAILTSIGVDIDPETPVKELTVGQMQMVEIAKAISTSLDILIMDEPTAALSEKEVEDLFKVIANLKKKGVSIVYISHRMDEILKISDRIAVMRDGEMVGTLLGKEAKVNDIIHMMVGRIVDWEVKTRSEVTKETPIVLEVNNLNGGILRDINFYLRKGEILGFSGLMGAGRTEVAQAIYGVNKPDSIEIKKDGVPIKIRSPKDAVKHGICYLSEDRKRYGLMLDHSVLSNEAISSYDFFSSFKGILDKKVRENANKENEGMRVKMHSLDEPIKNLSGGNQQKAILVRWLLKDADIFIFDEPTRGIDILSKTEIYDKIIALSKMGKSIILISSELAEITRLSDHVIIMHEGRISETLNIAHGDQQTIMKFATNKGETE